VIYTRRHGIECCTDGVLGVCALEEASKMVSHKIIYDSFIFLWRIPVTAVTVKSFCLVSRRAIEQRIMQ
jgi:hypothetical protein